MKEITDKLDKFSDSLLLNYASPNMGLVVDALQFNVNNLQEISDDTLSQYIVVLGQYLVMLQYQTNRKKVDAVLLSEHLENVIFQTRETADGEAMPKFTTYKQRKFWCIETNEEVKRLYEEALQAEAENSLIEGMVKSVDSYLNALKKEKSHRTPYEG